MHANYEVPIPLSLGVSWCPIHVDVGRSYDTCAEKLGYVSKKNLFFFTPTLFGWMSDTYKTLRVRQVSQKKILSYLFLLYFATY
jgi:hypothetical protein